MRSAPAGIPRVRLQAILPIDMALILHPSTGKLLARHYRHAFADATELLVVTAYLTDWDRSLTLGAGCRKFRIIIGKDFGITRKAACRTLMRWLPPERKGQFLVADRVDGFHPKAVFWKERDGEARAIIGSSNLTRAAFATNHEANALISLTPHEYEAARAWVAAIEKRSVNVTEDWIRTYEEVRPTTGAGRKGRSRAQRLPSPAIELAVPRPDGMARQIRTRRSALAIHVTKKAGLLRLFGQCAEGAISSSEFYERLPRYWSHEAGNRLQGAGWERQGKTSNFRTLARSFLTIVHASERDRDDVVIAEIDRLRRQRVPARKSFLSEMLCLTFPDAYPVLDKPVLRYLKDARFRGPRGASEGVRYLHLARALRASLRQNPAHPARNLAELDAVIWLAYRE